MIPNEIWLTYKDTKCEQNHDESGQNSTILKYY